MYSGKSVWLLLGLVMRIAALSYGRVALAALRCSLPKMHCATHEAGVEVAHVQLGAGRTASQRGHFDFLQLGLLQSLRLGASILKPDLHLCLSESQRR